MSLLERLQYFVDIEPDAGFSDSDTWNLSRFDEGIDGGFSAIETAGQFIGTGKLFYGLHEFPPTLCVASHPIAGKGSCRLKIGEKWWKNGEMLEEAELTRAGYVCFFLSFSTSSYL